jgi:hypothetical protein
MINQSGKIKINDSHLYEKLEASTQYFFPLKFQFVSENFTVIFLEIFIVFYQFLL